MKLRCALKRAETSGEGVRIGRFHADRLRKTEWCKGSTVVIFQFLELKYAFCSLASSFWTVTGLGVDLMTILLLIRRGDRVLLPIRSRFFAPSSSCSCLSGFLSSPGEGDTRDSVRHDKGGGGRGSGDADETGGGVDGGRLGGGGRGDSDAADGGGVGDGDGTGGLSLLPVLWSALLFCAGDLGGRAASGAVAAAATAAPVPVPVPVDAASPPSSRFLHLSSHE